MKHILARLPSPQKNQAITLHKHDPNPYCFLGVGARLKAQEVIASCFRSHRVLMAPPNLDRLVASITPPPSPFSRAIKANSYQLALLITILSRDSVYNLEVLAVFRPLSLLGISNELYRFSCVCLSLLRGESVLYSPAVSVLLQIRCRSWGSFLTIIHSHL